MATATGVQPGWRRLNWWKIGFFTALFAFEVMRELAFAGAEPTSLTSRANVFTYNGWTVAEGRWRRIDGGDELVPAAIRIECDRGRGECIEVSVSVHDGRVSPPGLERFKAQFAPDAITYENTTPLCVRYETRVDLKLEKVIAVRTRNDDTSEVCSQMEQRIEMQLGDAWDAPENPFKGHFAPLFGIFSWLLD